MAWKITTPPAVEPVTLAEAKAYLRLDHTTEDGLVTALIVAARQQVEVFTRQALVTQTVLEYFDAFPRWEPFDFDSLYLSVNPVQSVEAFTYIDQNGIEQELQTTDYELDSASHPARLNSSYDAKAWPGALLVPNAVRVEYVAGYGLAAAVPKGIISALFLLLGHMHTNRDAKGHNSPELPQAVKALLYPYRVAR